MRIFCKHILRSIRRAPLQSLLIVLTLIIATASFVVSVKSFFVIRDNLAAEEGVDNYISDITVTLSSESELRILFDEDLRDVVGNSGEILGEFSLEGLCERNGKTEFVKLYATDFEKADAFYKFKFTDYGRFDAKNYKKSIIVSTAFAEKYSLSVGDAFSFRLLNQRFDFTVQAIAVTEGPFYECGGVFSIDTVRDVLALSNPAINSFSEAFVPYSQLRVRVKNQAEIDTVLEKIRADERFADKIALKNSEEFRKFDFYSTVSLTVMAITSVLVVILSSLVVASSLELIRKKRKSDTALFALCGAERRHLNAIVYLEAVLYSVLGLLGGVPTARFMYEYVNKRSHFGYNGLKNNAIDWLVAALASIAVTFVSAFIHLSRENRRTSYELINENEDESESGRGKQMLTVSSVMLAVSLVFVAALPAYRQFVPSFLSLLAFLLWLFALLPMAFKCIARFLTWVLSKTKKTPPITFMTFKNVFASTPLRNTGRLLVILLVILSTIFFSISSVSGQVDMLETVFDCDWIAFGADRGCDELIEREACVAESYRVTFFENSQTEHGTGVFCVSAESDALPYINDAIDVDRMPQDEEIYISLGISKVCGADVGDSIKIYVDGEYHSFTVAKILKIKSNFVFIDARYVGSENDKLAIISKDGYSKEDQLSAISAVLNPRGAGAVDFYGVISEITKFTKLVIAYLEFIVLVAVLTTLIGVVNLVISQHGARGQERSVLYMAGFTKRKILLLEACEIFSVILLAVLLSLPGGYAFSAIFDFVLNSFGADFLH